MAGIEILESFLFCCFLCVCVCVSVCARVCVRVYVGGGGIGRSLCLKLHFHYQTDYYRVGPLPVSVSVEGKCHRTVPIREPQLLKEKVEPLFFFVCVFEGKG